MSDRFKFLLKSGWEYFLKAKTIYDIDSPYVYPLCKELFDHKKKKIIFAQIEERRKKLIADKSTFTRTDLGSGSLDAALNQTEIRISTWAKNSSISPYYGKLLYRLVSHVQPKTILEMGTAAGISASYLSIGLSPLSSLCTIEGDPESARIAMDTFKILSLSNIRLIQGSFDSVLDDALKVNAPDMIFIDGHHQSRALLKYLDIIYPSLPMGISTIILDDIRWNEDMFSVWSSLSKDPRWQLSIDLFRMGLLIKNPDVMQHQTYTVIDRKLKPWRLGIVR